MGATVGRMMDRCGSADGDEAPLTDARPAKRVAVPGPDAFSRAVASSAVISRVLGYSDLATVLTLDATSKRVQAASRNTEYEIDIYSARIPDGASHRANDRYVQYWARRHSSAN